MKNEIEAQFLDIDKDAVRSKLKEIGANTFLEAGFAYYLGKPIYALRALPDQPYIHNEIESLGIKVIDDDLSKIGVMK